MKSIIIRKQYPWALVLAVLLWLLGGGPARAQLLQQKAFGTATGSEEMGTMTSLRAGGYLLAGTQQASQASKLYLLRLNAAGDTLWTRRYTVPGFFVLYVENAVEDAAGRVLLVGSGATLSAATQDDAYLVMLSPQGDTLWTRRTQSPFKDRYSRPQLTPAGDFVLAANLEGAPQLVRISSSGQRLQQTIAAFSPSDFGQVGLLMPAANGGYWAYSGMTAPPYSSKFIRFDAAGNLMADIPIPPNFPVLAPSVPIPVIRDFYFTGTEYFLATGADVTRVDANLNVLWTRTLTARGYPFGPEFIRATPDGNFLVGGRINTTSGGQDLGFAKISPAGLSLKDTVLIRPGNETLCGLAVAPGTGNYVFAGWSTSGPIGGEDIFWGELRRSTVTAARPGLAPAAALTAYPNPVGADGVVQLAAGRALRGTLTLRDALGREQGQALARQRRPAPKPGPAAGPAPRPLPAHPGPGRRRPAPNRAPAPALSRQGPAATVGRRSAKR